MIPIREIEYELPEEPTSVFSRLTWVVERVGNLFGQLVTNRTVSTHKRWVGTLNDSDLSFGLVRPSSMWKPRIFQIIVKGKILSVNGKTTVRIKLKLGFYTSLIFLAIYGFAIFMITMLIQDFSLNILTGVGLWLATFPVGGTLLLNYKLGQVEDDLDNLFDR